MNFENFLDELKVNIPLQFENYSIVEEQIDFEVQIEYFEFSRKYRSDFEKNEVLSRGENLFSKDTSILEKKILISQLSIIEDVTAFRIIERYCLAPDDELALWSKLALRECRAILEGSLLNTNQILISTGLGGKGNKLRYFVVFIAKNALDFTDSQQKIIRSELDYHFQKYDAELEELDFKHTYATSVSLIPLNISIQHIFQEVLEECNQLGDFLDNRFLVTNYKRMTFEEIEAFVLAEETE